MDTGENSRLRQQIAALRSSNRPAILDTLRELRSEGDISILPELFNLLLVQEDTEIRGEITGLLNDLKEEEAAGILAGAVSNTEYEEIQATLVAACWQNGLTYSRYLPVFVDVLVSGSYEAAIEAFTVIEEAVGDLETREQEKLVNTLKSRAGKADEQKKALFEELVRVIENYGGPAA